ncbi:MAG: hypothetical protein M3M99_01040 [Actinomycetota bacterium]|nr:hypothetical protein [Actinomycetota bacterium]
MGSGENDKTEQDGKQGKNSRTLKIDPALLKKNPAGLKPENAVQEPAYSDDPLARSLFLIDRMRKIGAISYQEYLIAKQKIMEEHG